MTLVKTGGIYIHSDITNTEVYLDGEFVKNNGVLLRNTFIQKLRPEKEYQIRIDKEGFNTWTKTFFVYPSLVAEGNVMMLPLEIEKRGIFPFIDVDGLGTTTPDLEKLDILIPTNKEYNDLVEIFNPAVSTTTKPVVIDVNEIATNTLVSKSEIPEYFIELGISDPEELENLIVLGNEVSYLENENVILNWIGKKDSQPFYYCLNLQDCRTQIILDWDDEIKSFDFYPGRNDILVALTENGIFAVEVDDRSTRNINAIYLGQDLDFIKSDNDRIVVKDGEVFYEISL